MKKILFITDPLSTFNILSDTTYMFMLTAYELGYQVSYALTKDIHIENNVAITTSTVINISKSINDTINADDNWYKEEHSQRLALNQFNYVFVRNDPPFDMEYFYLTQALSIAELNGAKIINNSFSLRNFNEKLSILNFPELITSTLVSKNKAIINEFINKHKECVIKPLDLMAGRGVFKLDITDVNCDTIIENSTNHYTKTVMVQKFIPEVVHGDRRIFIVDGAVVDYCLYRIPQENQIRGNIAAGGIGVVHKIPSEDYNLAIKVAKWLKQQKIIFAGIDVIGNKLTEINITSPTGARQIYQATKINIAKLVFDVLS